MIRALVVDDEPLARDVLRFFLDDEPDVLLVGESANGREAAAAIRQEEPDLVFLDVRMPDQSGLDVIAEIGPENMPAVIFVTAFDEHAVEAFELHAVDYLLKPVAEERLRQAVARARERFRLRQIEDAAGQLNQVLGHLAGSGDGTSGTRSLGSDRLLVRSRDRVSILRLEDLEWIEAAGDYVYLHTERRKHLLRRSLASLEAQLDRQRFRRIHRRAIVNLERIDELQATDHGEYRVLLLDGTVLKLTRSYRKNLADFLE